MGINIGAFVCNIIAAFMRNKFQFGRSIHHPGIGMFLGLIIFSFWFKTRKNLKWKPPKGRYQNFWCFVYFLTYHYCRSNWLGSAYFNFGKTILGVPIQMPLFLFFLWFILCFIIFLKPILMRKDQLVLCFLSFGGYVFGQFLNKMVLH